MSRQSQSDGQCPDVPSTHHTSAPRLSYLHLCARPDPPKPSFNLKGLEQKWHLQNSREAAEERNGCNKIAWREWGPVCLEHHRKALTCAFGLLLALRHEIKLALLRFWVRKIGQLTTQRARHVVNGVNQLIITHVEMLKDDLPSEYQSKCSSF